MDRGSNPLTSTIRTPSAARKGFFPAKSGNAAQRVYSVEPVPERSPMYRNHLKRIFDFALALAALVCLSPLLLALTAAGAVAMRGNPFFAQWRPGRDERLFRLVNCAGEGDPGCCPGSRRQRQKVSDR